jgi:hypothetical protein
VLIGIGYVIDYSYQQFLGYIIGDAAPAEYYVSLTGQFFVRTVVVLLEAFPQHSLLLMVFILGSVAAYVILSYLESKQRVKIDTIRAVVLACLLVLLGGQIVVLDWPAFEIRDLLTRDLQPIDGSLTIAGRDRTAALYKREVCSRIDPLRYPIARKRGIACVENVDYRQELRDYFGLNLLLTAAIAIATTLILRKQRGNSRVQPPNADLVEQVVRSLLRGAEASPVVDPPAPSITNAGSVIRPLTWLLTSMLTIHGFGLLNTYVRTTKSTEFEEVTFFLAEPEERLPRDSATTYATPLIDQGPFSGFLLSADENWFTVYVSVEGKIWLLDAENIRAMQFKLQEDVIEAHITHKLAEG